MPYKSAARLTITKQTPTYTGGVLKRWNGSAWVKSLLKAYISGSWQTKPLKRWTGTEWLEIDATG